MADDYLKMLLAYQMQVLFILYMWIVARVIPGVLWWMGLTPSQKDKKQPKKTRAVKFRAWQKKVLNHVSITKSVLVDFHEFQCFFIICIQAAILVAFSGDAGILGATNLWQLSRNYEEATWISCQSIASVTLGLWMLQRSGLDSPYIAFWSLAAIILSGITFSSKNHQQPNPNGLDRSLQFGNLDKCGYNPPPLIYCSSPGESDLDINRNLVLPCFVIYGAIRIAKFIPRLAETLGFWRSSVELYLVAICALFFKFGLNDVDDRVSYNTLTKYDWTFGQILSVTIWVPMVTKYLFWAFGMS